MILQALNDYYEALAARGKIIRRGWSKVKVSFALTLDSDGDLIDIMPLTTEETRGKKTVEVSMQLDVPEQVKRTVGIAANILCDNSSYFLGFDAKGKPERSKDCFLKAKEEHLAFLSQVDSPAARAVRAYFERWEPEKAEEHPVLTPYLDQIKKGGNLVFRYDGKFVQNDDAIQKAWGQHKQQGGDAPMGRCLVTGELGAIARLHPAIKGVRDAQSSGASLVSFNADSFTSYGKEQSYNAPVSEAAAYAYGTALNALIADRDHTQYLGDTLVLYWAKSAENAYADAFGGMLGGSDNPITEGEISRAIDLLADGYSCDFNGATLSPGMDFYVLGIAPNAARLVIRFFYHNTFGNLMENFRKHQKRLEIARPAYDQKEQLSVWALLNETANQHAQDKKPPKVLIGSLLRSILEDTPYPTLLYNSVIIRIRAEHEINRKRAAILKACLTKQLEKRKDPSAMAAKEVLIVQLNDESSYMPFLLGRLFAVLEQLQLSANPGINSTIRDRYFNTACTNPATAFPVLIRLAQNHLRKLDMGLEVHYNKMIGEIMGRFSESYPLTLSLQDQGIFQIGYYQQTQKMYTKKED